MKQNLQKRLRFLLPLLLLFLLVTGFLLHNNNQKDERAFRALTENLFRREMLSNTINMHYTLADPSRFGIVDYRPVLSVYSSLNAERNRAEMTALSDNLKEIQIDKLSEENVWLHTLLSRYLEQSVTLNSFSYFAEPLSPNSGVQSELPILLAEYTFRTKKDVTDYLAILEQVEDYFSSLLLYEKEKASCGRIMPEAFISSVQKQCDTIVTKYAIKNGTHFLQTTFTKRLEKLLNIGVITEKEMTDYTDSNNQLLLSKVLPAYRSLRDGLEPLKDSTVPICGLASYPQGREYYEALLACTTGSSRSMDEIKTLLIKQLNEEYDALRDIFREHPEVAEKYRNDDICDLPDVTAEEMLADLKHRMSKDFPPLDQQSCSLSIKDVSPFLEPYCAPAFYLTAPIDDTSQSVIYINRRKTPHGCELYTTLAHEGYPGHLYQDVYCKRLVSPDNTSPIRAMLWYGGYLEGWALYVELLSYDYAGELLKKQATEDDALCLQIEKHNRSLQLCLYSLLDISIHHENASLNQVSKILERFGIHDSNTASAIYTYIVSEPCNYLKYYLGCLEIQSLQDKARSQWGAEYTDLRFHTFLLDNGPADFKSLEERLVSS